MSASDVSLCKDGFYEFAPGADYVNRGEKPIAYAATFEYCKRKQLTGLTMQQVLKDPLHSAGIRTIFVELAEKSKSPLKSPSSSWGVITGSREREFQKMIPLYANLAFAKLDATEMTEMTEMAEWCFDRINSRRVRGKSRQQST